MKRIALILAIAPMFQLLAVPGTVRTTAGDEKSGDIKWQPRQKTYLISFKNGKTDVMAEYRPDEVEKFDIAKPAGYDKAIALVDNGQGAQAVAILSKIVSEYRMLEWDRPAAAKLAMAYLAMGQTSKADDACRGIISDDRTAAYRGVVAPAYWEVLLKQGKTEQLGSLLKKASGSGDRVASAAAFIIRGDMAIAGGRETPDNCRKALVDGYLRVVMMYSEPECREVRITAMQKAAACLDKLGKASQAERLRAQAKSI